MARKRLTTEQIIYLVLETEVRLSQCATIGLICRGLGVSEQSYDRRRRDCGGLKIDQAKRLKNLERVTTRRRSLKRSSSLPNSMTVMAIAG